MGRYKPLTDYQRDAVALLAHNGHTNRQIAAAVGAHQATVAKVAARVRRMDVLETPKATVRRPLLDARDRRRLVRIVLNHDELELLRIVALFNIMADIGSTKDVVLREDLATPHNVRSTRSVQRELRLKVLRWVGQSPDLNSIESAWAELERRLRRREVVPKNKKELFGALQEEWRAIPDAYFEKLADTMKHRCAAVVKVNGWPTKY